MARQKPFYVRVRAAAMMRAGIPRKCICAALQLSQNTLNCWVRRGRKRGDTAWRSGHLVDNLFHVDEGIAGKADEARLTDEQKLLLLSFAALHPNRRATLIEFFTALVPADPHRRSNRRRRLGSLAQTPIPRQRNEGYPELASERTQEVLNGILDLDHETFRQLMWLFDYKRDTIDTIRINERS